MQTNAGQQAMYRIDLNGAEVFYFTADDPLPDEPFEGKKIHGLWSGWEELNKVRAEHSDELRCIIALNETPLDYYELYLLLWNNGQDLQALDSRVRQGTYRPEDFTPAAETWFRYTFCLSCDYPNPELGKPHRHWLSLEIRFDSAMYWQRRLLKKFTDEEMRTLGLLSWQKGFEPMTCPACGKRFNLYVVRIYGLKENPLAAEFP